MNVKLLYNWFTDPNGPAIDCNALERQLNIQGRALHYWLIAAESRGLPKMYHQRILDWANANGYQAYVQQLLSKKW